MQDTVVFAEIDASHFGRVSDTGGCGALTVALTNAGLKTSGIGGVIVCCMLSDERLANRLG
jgi:hypothetical protein